MQKRLRHSFFSLRNLILVTVIVGLVGTGFGVFVSHPYALTVPPVVTLGALAAAVVRRRGFSVSTAAPSLSKRPLLSLYFVLLALTIVTFTVDPGHGRPLSTHVLLLGLYMLTVLVLFVFDSPPFQLGVLLTTGVVHRALIYYGSATQLGLDALFHTRMVAQIGASGSLAPLAAASSKYWYTPVYHLAVAGSTLLGGLSVRDAAFVTITLFATVLPVLVVYQCLSPVWGARVAGLGGFLFLVGDRAVSHAVHVTPTTLGFALFSVTLFAVVRYLNTGEWSYYGVIVVTVLGQVFNHPVSLFVTIVGVGAYICSRVLWRGRVTKREIALVAPASAVLYQGFVTKINGPNGDLSIVALVVRNFKRSFDSENGATVSQLPESADVVLANTSSLSSIHVLGLAVLFGISVFGALYWLSVGKRSNRGFVYGLCGTAVVMSSFVFIPPLVGVYVFFSHRWLPFLYLCLAILAAPGLAILLSHGFTRCPSSRSKQLGAIALTLLVVVAPYTALMAWNYPGALDGPVFDSSPGAQRLTATSTEVATYTHIDEYEYGTTVFADNVARQMIERHYDHPAAGYQVHYENSRLIREENVLIVDRAYSRTNHAQYFVKYQGRWFDVFGPLPVDRSRYSVVYSAGEDRILYAG